MAILCSTSMRCNLHHQQSFDCSTSMHVTISNTTLYVQFLVQLATWTQWNPEVQILKTYMYALPDSVLQNLSTLITNTNTHNFSPLYALMYHRKDRWMFHSTQYITYGLTLRKNVCSSTPGIPNVPGIAPTATTR